MIGSDEKVYIGTNDEKLYAVGTEVIEAVAGDIKADMNKDGKIITPGDALAIFEIFIRGQ